MSSPPRRTARCIRLFYVKRWPSLAKAIQTPHFVAAGVLNANVYRKRSGDAYPSKAAQRPGNPLAEGLPRGANYFSPLATLITDGVFIILRAFGRRPERPLARPSPKSEPTAHKVTLGSSILLRGVGCASVHCPEITEGWAAIMCLWVTTLFS